MCLQALLDLIFGKGKKIASELNSTIDESRISSESGDPRIIIIGAGVAGLACAMKLREYGIDNILILEAENRIGGRVHTMAFAENVVDLGAQWVHGEENNVVYQMVQKYKLLDTSGELYKEFDCIRSNGEIVPPMLIDRLKRTLNDIFEQSVGQLNEFPGSFGEYLDLHYCRAISVPKMKDIDKDVAIEFFENFKRMESTESSSGVDEVSAQGFNEYWQCPGDYLLNWKDKGYVTFLHMLMRMNETNLLGDLEGCIKFDCRAESIIWNGPDGKATVVCDKGNLRLDADHVVITVSLGVLKEHVDSMFYPPLPLKKKCAIVGLGFGSVCKIFLEFINPPWPDKWNGFTTLWRKSDLEDLRRSEFHWVEELFGFYRVNYQPRVLVAWIVGPYVLKVEKMPEEEVRNGCMYVLRRFLGRRWKISDPIDIQITRWQSNPNFMGAYSFRSMLSEELHASASQLAQPVTVVVPDSSKNSGMSVSAPEKDGDVKAKPILLFAGEATSEHYFSTVHGAVESGQREAKRLLTFHWNSSL